MKPLDYLVIGGGPAGATAALLLARAGRSVAVVEQAAFPRRKVCGEFIGAAYFPLLETLELLDAGDVSEGPEIRRVGLYAGEFVGAAPMPRCGGASRPFGKALRRDRLETRLLSLAARYGAQVYQPWSVISVQADGDASRCLARQHGGTPTAELHTRCVIAAHGSWGRGPLTAFPGNERRGERDLLAFKAYFGRAPLDADLMPLIAFPGGYGGIVQGADGLATLSLCVRRGRLAARRRRCPGASAGEALLACLLEHCRGLREALDGASREGAWIAAGPLRPGIRAFGARNAFLVGNAAAEAHPLIAEGIGMAMESGALLARLLLEETRSRRGPRQIAADYERRWKARFAMRLQASKLLAAWAMHPAAASAARLVIGHAPSLLTLGARLSGKAGAA